MRGLEAKLIRAVPASAGVGKGFLDMEKRIPLLARAGNRPDESQTPNRSSRACSGIQLRPNQSAAIGVFLAAMFLWTQSATWSADPSWAPHQCPGAAQCYPRRADLQRGRLPTSANPAKPISSIAVGGISGIDVAGVTLRSPSVPPKSGSVVGPFRLTKSDAGANASLTTGGVTSQASHASGKVPWISPDGQVMAKLFCAAVISNLALGLFPPTGGFELGRFELCCAGCMPPSDPAPGLVAMRELRSSSVSHRWTALDVPSLAHEPPFLGRSSEGPKFEGRSDHGPNALTEKPPT
jgi:hypothetical protein